MDNPLVLHTQKALQNFGMLIRRWTLEPDKRPELRAESDRILVIGRKIFEMELGEVGLFSGRDYTLRDGVNEVELILRRPDRCALILPEVDVLTEIGQPWSEVRYPKLNLDPYRAGMTDVPPPVKGDEPASQVLALGKNPYVDFLDAFMASYLVAQCK
ncbi:MAG: hypothetical protein AAF367_04000 [Pseudomonadota bacterium]